MEQRECRKNIEGVHAMSEIFVHIAFVRAENFINEKQKLIDTGIKIIKEFGVPVLRIEKHSYLKQEEIPVTYIHWVVYFKKR